MSIPVSQSQKLCHNSPEPRDIQFDMIWNGEKQEIAKLERLKTAISANFAWKITYKSNR